MFRLPKGDLHDEEGKCDDDPIHLLGIKKDEFEQLLSVLFHRRVHHGTWITRSRSLTRIISTFHFRPHRTWTIHIDRTHSTRQKPFPETRDQWTSVLKLAILWEFDTIRQVALDHLEREPAADRIYLGQAFDLDFEYWLLPAMHEIVRRHKPISVEEANLMGLDTTLKLASVREHVTFGLPLDSHRWEAIVQRRPIVVQLDFSQILRKTFQNSSG